MGATQQRRRVVAPWRAKTGNRRKSGIISMSEDCSELFERVVWASGSFQRQAGGPSRHPAIEDPSCPWAALALRSLPRSSAIGRPFLGESIRLGTVLARRPTLSMATLAITSLRILSVPGHGRTKKADQRNINCMIWPRFYWIGRPTQGAR